MSSATILSQVIDLIFTGKVVTTAKKQIFVDQAARHLTGQADISGLTNNQKSQLVLDAWQAQMRNMVRSGKTIQSSVDIESQIKADADAEAAAFEPEDVPVV